MLSVNRLIDSNHFPRVSRRGDNFTAENGMGTSDAKLPMWD